MVEITTLTENQLREIAARQRFPLPIIRKDYYLTAILYLLRDVTGIYFKGGTALQKIFLEYARLSEDADFTVTGDLAELRKSVTALLQQSSLFVRIISGKAVENFLRLEAWYETAEGEDRVLIDLNRRAKLLRKPERHEIPHFYTEAIPSFSCATLSRDEMIAEKMRAAIMRNKPRDHFDLYRIIKEGLPIDLRLVREKCVQAKIQFDIIRMFNRAKTLKNRWDVDLLPLLAEEVPFREVMAVLARHFKLKEEKERQKGLI